MPLRSIEPDPVDEIHLDDSQWRARHGIDDDRPIEDHVESISARAAAAARLARRAS